MTPKDKAKELVEKFTPIHNDLTPIDKIESDFRWAKKCALICVANMIEEIKLFGNDDGYQITRIDYWQEVKQEIENFKNE